MDIKPPSVASIAGDTEIEHAIATLVLAFGADPVARWMYDDPHQSLIGVEVLHRNKGCGAALLEYRLRQCDQEHLPAYLWSSNPQNTSLYERHGFEIAGTIRVGSSPSVFPMLRRAR